jgi:hypothetical protein
MLLASMVAMAANAPGAHSSTAPATSPARLPKIERLFIVCSPRLTVWNFVVVVPVCEPKLMTDFVMSKKMDYFLQFTYQTLKQDIFCFLSTDSNFCRLKSCLPQA